MNFTGDLLLCSCEHNENSSHDESSLCQRNVGDLPYVAIKWVILNCTSDTELATLSNVSKRWRRIVTKEIISFVTSVTDCGVDKSSVTDNAIDNEQSAPSSPSSFNKKLKNLATSPLFSLILPSMLIEKIKLDSMNLTDTKQSHLRVNQDLRKDSIQGRFCLAWFHPAGIQLADLSASKKFSNKNWHERMIPCIPPEQILSNTSSANDACVLEWRGYTNAEEILRPFLYCKMFIQNLLLLATAPGMNSSNEDANTLDQTVDCNYAVRGAAVAKPRHSGRRPRKSTNGMSIEIPHENCPRVVLERQHSATKALERHLAVQFLSHDRSRAVCMNTGPWKCGEVDQPVTAFLVGIATEDGVFFSGLSRRFSLGHLYPDIARNGEIESSNICISTETMCIPPTSPNSASQYVERLRLASDLDNSAGVCASDGICSTQLFCSDSSDEGAYLSSNASTSPMSDAVEDEIFRGRTGPGMWHCYTAVFDGKNSMIRVDGLSESLGGSRQHSCGNGVLDGLTIGSDHKFHLSLCFGDGSDGEGEGAISELAIFKGRLPIEDILSIEKHLMNKHGISKASEKSWAEDEMRRKVHALITQPSPWTDGGPPIPLRFAAQHPLVAWFKTNSVTGNQIAIKRIGCRSTAQSSDW